MRKIIFWSTLSLALCGAFASRARGAGGGFTQVVNAQNAVSSLSASDVKRVLSGGTKVWESGAVVQLGLAPGDAGGMQYLAGAVDTTPRELLSMLQQQVFKGELRRPVVLRSSADCFAFASQTPGALCVAATGVPVPAGAKVVALR